jgi:hypothetical protein
MKLSWLGTRISFPVIMNVSMQPGMTVRPVSDAAIREIISPRGRWRRLTRTTAAGVLLASAGAFGIAAAEPLLRVTTAPGSGQTVVLEGTTRVLQFNHQTIDPPPATLARIADANLKYARSRSDYIHPLYGPSGEELTLDWAVDHPHHRGIYWAWPEVGFNGQTGDLHALQRVFARPVAKPVTRDGDQAAVIEAESEWKWEDQTPIVREKIVIRVEKAGPHGRRIDLTITLNAVADGVTIARRDTDKYGGLNSRFAAAKALAITHHVDAPETTPRMAWHRAAGTWNPAPTPASVTIFEKSTNPGYPADHVEYPELPWFQPTFPKAGTRHPLKQGEQLVLHYRYLIHSGAAGDEKALRDEWLNFNPSQPTTTP